MPYFLLILLIITIFGCTSISQSYASAKQAEAAIEANKTAQLALGGQIAISILLALVVVILVLVILALLYHLSKKQTATSQYSENLFSQDDFSILDDSNKGYQFLISHDERENEPSILPSGWGW